MATYLLPTPEGATVLSWIVITAIAGAAILVTAVSVRGHAKMSRNRLYATLLILLVVGAVSFVLLDPLAQSSVTVTSGQLSVNAPFVSVTIHPDQVAQAYVVNLNDWNLSLSNRVVGTALGSYYEGQFTLSNGAAADVLTDSAINLVVKTTSGQYLVLAPDDFQAFLSDFSANVTTVVQPSATN